VKEVGAERERESTLYINFLKNALAAEWGRHQKGQIDMLGGH
jgi:hypothetical protein